MQTTKGARHRADSTFPILSSERFEAETIQKSTGLLRKKHSHFGRGHPTFAATSIFAEKMKRGITDLRVAALQTALHWEDAEANIKHVQHHISLQEGEVDLIVLPEMWSSGFSMRPEHVAMNWDDAWIDQTDRWPEPLKAMRRWSQEKNAAIVGSISCRIKSDDRFVNRCFFVSPSI